MTQRNLWILIVNSCDSQASLDDNSLFNVDMCTRCRNYRAHYEFHHLEQIHFSENTFAARKFRKNNIQIDDLRTGFYLALMVTEFAMYLFESRLSMPKYVDYILAVFIIQDPELLDDMNFVNVSMKHTLKKVEDNCIDSCDKRVSLNKNS